jgi:hypothetical protein
LYLVSYSDENFRKAQIFNTKTALAVGGFESAFEYGPSKIDSTFRAKNDVILNSKRGGGYWLWKPYVILDALAKIEKNEILAYVDSGSHFIGDMRQLIAVMSNKDILSFELELPEFKWTKRDAFYFMGCEGENYQLSNQRLASFIVFRKSSFSEDFVSQYLDFCCDRRIVTDDQNVCGLPNFEGFVEHRHDQSVFSLLCKKNKIEAHRDPSQWGNNFRAGYQNSPYPQLIEHTRHRIPKHDSLFYRMKRYIFSR